MLQPKRVTRAFLTLVALGLSACQQDDSPPAPPDNPILSVTREWGRESALGDLLAWQPSGDDVELRLWRGFSNVLNGTRGLILRRRAGGWKGWEAVVHNCMRLVPTEVEDTLSEAHVAEIKAELRRNCSIITPRTSGRLIRQDTVELRELRDVDLAATWKAARRAGALKVPPVVRMSPMDVGRADMVLEVRTRQVYQATMVGCFMPAETDTERSVERITTALRRTTGRDWIECFR